MSGLWVNVERYLWVWGRYWEKNLLNVVILVDVFWFGELWRVWCLDLGFVVYLGKIGVVGVMF